MRKAFDPEKVNVSLFEKVVRRYTPGCSDEQMMKEYAEIMDYPKEMKLTEFLTYGTRYINTLKKVWEEPDKKKRRELKKYNLAGAVISCMVKTRRKNKSLSEKIKQYNSVVVLDFDDVFDVEEAKKKVAALPYVYYVGLSASKRGMWAIVPVDNDDYGRHEIFYYALTQEMRKLGLEVDQQCKPVNWLRFVSFDDAPIYNNNCEYYSLPEGMEDEYWESLKKTGRPLPTDADDQAPLDTSYYYAVDEECPEQNPEDALMESAFPGMKGLPKKGDPLKAKIKAYCEEWERKGIAVQSYDDWMRIGMALSTQGEFGWEIFDRISAFSTNYDRDANRKIWERFVKNTSVISIGTFFYKCHQYGVMPYTPRGFEENIYPVDVFPVDVQRIINETNRCLNFSKDHIASSLMFVASVAVGNSIRVELKRKWYDKAIMYMALVGKPGSNKSAPLRFAMEPLEMRDDREMEKYRKEREKFNEAKRKAFKGNGYLPDEPDYNQTIMNDFTTEVLIRQHNVNPRGLAVYVDELIGFIRNFNKYRTGNDEQVWTQLFNGGAVAVNRMNSVPLKINDTFIGIIGTIQPGLLPEFAKGKMESGFLDRWLFSFPDTTEYPQFTLEELDEEITDKWLDIIRRISAIPLDDERRTIRLTDEAKRIYMEWYNAIAKLKNDPKFLLPEAATKMERYCIRFAIILEALKYGCGQETLDSVSVDSVKGGIDLCSYYLSCAFKARRLFKRSPVDNMSELQKAIYQELPISFITSEGVQIAARYGMKERTFKDWIKTEPFKHMAHGQYERRYT